jgi:hypothetical protein
MERRLRKSGTIRDDILGLDERYVCMIPCSLISTSQLRIGPKFVNHNEKYALNFASDDCFALLIINGLAGEMRCTKRDEVTYPYQ